MPVSSNRLGHHPFTVKICGFEFRRGYKFEFSEKAYIFDLVDKIIEIEKDVRLSLTSITLVRIQHFPPFFGKFAKWIRHKLREFALAERFVIFSFYLIKIGYNA